MRHLSSPRFVVHTSSGPAGINRQLHYLFEHPLPPQEAADLARLARQKTGGDNCTIDLAHVWRVPGTYNLPDWRKIARGRSPEPQPVTLAGGTGQPVDPAALRAALEGMPDRVTPAPGAALAEANGRRESPSMRTRSLPGFRPACSGQWKSRARRASARTTPRTLPLPYFAKGARTRKSFGTCPRRVRIRRQVPGPECGRPQENSCGLARRILLDVRRKRRR